MKKVFKYCDICRGDDGPFMKCLGCKRVFHNECVGYQIVQEKWKCSECIGNEADCTKQKKVAKSSAEIENIRNRIFWGSYLEKERASFINANKSSLEAFTDKETIHRCISVKAVAIDGKMKAVFDTEPIQTTPPYICNATLREYQIFGASQMFSWYLRGIGGILADEMGLGKTIQTITLLASLKNKLGLSGPHLVVTPLAVLQNWANELNRFAPSMSFKKIYGTRSERSQIMCDERVVNGGFDIYLTTYETLICEEPFFTDSWSWVRH